MPRQPVLTLITSVALISALVACGGNDGDEPVEPASSGTASAESDESDGDSAEADGGDEDTSDEADGADEWAALTDEPSGAKFELPVKTSPEENTATIGDGSAVDLRNYSTVSADDIEVGFNVIDSPGGYYSFDEGVDGVASTLDGDVVSSSETEVDGNAAVDVEMSYGDDYIVFFQLITTDDYIVQSLASGPENRRKDVEQAFHRLNKSVEVH